MATELERAIAEAAALMPGVPAALLEVYANALLVTGNADLAIVEMRADPQYDTYFAGNKRDDGSVRWTEKEYLSIIEAFEVELEGYGVNPAVFAEKFPELIAGDVAPDEFRSRLSTAYGQLINATEEVRTYYAENFGITDLTDESVFAAFLDPTIGEEILGGRLDVAAVGGAGLQYGFDLDPELAERLAQQDITGQQAGQLFSQAATQLPILDTLARRHNDPDDDFDLEEFLAAAVDADPTQSRRLRRLFAQESSLFSRQSAFRTSRDTGGITGLLDR